MKIKLVCLEDGIVAYGFRKIVAAAEAVNPDTQSYFISTNLNRSLTGLILNRYGGAMADRYIDDIAEALADADMVGFSSMTGYADLTKAIIRQLRKKSKSVCIIWGGIHPIVCPEDAAASEVDAICTGEGELAFQELIRRFQKGEDIFCVKNFWFKQNGRLVKNGFRPLATPSEMDALPFPKYFEDEAIYHPGKGFRQITKKDCLDSFGLAYIAIWTIGCPFRCTYCSNSKFLNNDPKYAKIRHTSPARMVAEVKAAMAKLPHISVVSFHDDNFIALPKKELEWFAHLWKKEIGLPFAIYGLSPQTVDGEKLAILTRAGLNRVRMGIQSGSQRILDWYKRSASVKQAEAAAAQIARFSKYHIPPAYDIILDNPIERRQDTLDTLELLYRLPRPYFLYIFSLRLIPNTEMERIAKESGVHIKYIGDNYADPAPTFANLMVYLLTFYRPPAWLFKRMMTRVKPSAREQKRYPVTAFVLRFCYLVNRAFSHLRFMDFSVITGSGGYLLWRTGLVGFWQRFLTPRLKG